MPRNSSSHMIPSLINDLPEPFLELLQNSTLQQKNAMMKALQYNIQSNETPTQPHISSPKEQSPSHTHSLEDMVEFIPEFNTDKTFLDGLYKEAESLNLPRGNKPASKWLSTSNKPYCFGNVTHDANPLKDYPYIMELMNSINAHTNVTGTMAACLVVSLSNYNAAISLHADDEASQIDQASPICTFSIGSSRTIQFCKKGGKPNDPPVISHELHSGSLTIMKAGCQQVLKHRVNKGNFGDKRRYVFSFRALPSTNSSPISNRSGLSSPSTQVIF